MDSRFAATAQGYPPQLRGMPMRGSIHDAGVIGGCGVQRVQYGATLGEQRVHTRAQTVHLPSGDPPEQVDMWVCGDADGDGCFYSNFMLRRVCRRCLAPRPREPRVYKRQWTRRQQGRREEDEDAARSGPIGADGRRPILLRGQHGDGTRRTTLPAPPPPPPPPAPSNSQRPTIPAVAATTATSTMGTASADGMLGREGGDDGGAWILGGPSRAQRRQMRKREVRAARRDERRLAGEQTGGVAGGGRELFGALGRDSDEGEGDDAEMDVDVPAAQPFVRPDQPRRVLAARVKVLEDTVRELRLQGADQRQIDPVELSLEAARKSVKDAGGATDGGLRTAIMSEARKLSRREAAVVRAGHTREQLQKKVEDAVAELTKHDGATEQLRAKVNYSRERYAYLVSQQAAEGQLAPRAEAVHRAFAAIREVGGGLGQEVVGHIEVVSNAIALVFGDGHISGREALADAWIDSDEGGDGGGHEADDDGDIDDEPEIRGDMLHNVHIAEEALRAARVERNKSILQACRTGAAVPEEEERALRAKIEEAVKSLVAAKEVLVRARRAAAARIEAEAEDARRRLREEEAAEEQRRAAAAAVCEQERSRAEAGKRGGSAEGVERVGDEDDTPCPPPCKWRRAPSESSDPTQEEEEVPQVPTAAVGEVAAAGTGLQAGRASSEGRVDPPRRGTRGAGEPASGRRVGGAVRAAAQALEARREDHDGGRVGRDARRVEEGAMEVDKASAPRHVGEMLADGALEVVQAAVAVAAVGGTRGRGSGREDMRSRSPAR